MALDFGGHMRFTYDGSSLVMRGKFDILATNLKIDVVTNDNGSISQTGKPRAVRIDVDFEDSSSGSASSQDWQAIMLGSPYNIMIAEDDTGVVHTCAGAKLGGEPKIDRMNGTVSGVEIHVPRNGYSKVVR